jgi:hypothetical protein
MRASMLKRCPVSSLEQVRGVFKKDVGEFPETVSSITLPCITLAAVAQIALWPVVVLNVAVAQWWIYAQLVCEFSRNSDMKFPLLPYPGGAAFCRIRPCPNCKCLSCASSRRHNT